MPSIFFITRANFINIDMENIEKFAKITTDIWNQEKMVIETMSKPPNLVHNGAVFHFVFHSWYESGAAWSVEAFDLTYRVKMMINSTLAVENKNESLLLMANNYESLRCLLKCLQDSKSVEGFNHKVHSYIQLLNQSGRTVLEKWGRKGIIFNIVSLSNC